MEELKNLLIKYLNQDLEQLVLSDPRKGREERKVRIRPVLLKGQLKFQAEIFRGVQAFHENLSREEAAERILGWMEDTFCQLQLSGAEGDVTALVSKKGRVTVKEKRKQGQTELSRRTVWRQKAALQSIFYPVKVVSSAYPD